MAGYGSDAEFQAWLDANGLTLPVGSPTLAVLRQIGSDYIDAAYEPRLSCSSRTGGFAQERAWPRVGHEVNCEPVPDDMIPQPWINASYRAAYLQAVNGFATGGTDPNRVVKMEKVDVLQVEYAVDKSGGNAADGFAVDPMIDGWVSLWLCATGRANWFMVI